MDGFLAKPVTLAKLAETLMNGRRSSGEDRAGALSSPARSAR